MRDQKKVSIKNTRWQKHLALLLTLLIVAGSLFGQPILTAAATNDGKPWIDYCLKENQTETSNEDIKDDFYMAVNRDWLLNTSIRPGYSVEYGFNVIEDEIIENSKKLLEDQTIKGKDAEQIRQLYSSILDWDSRNKAGLKPIQPTVKAIRKISSMEELSDFICANNDLSLGVSTLVDCGNGVALDDSNVYITYINGDSDFLLGDAAEYTKRTEYGDRMYKGNRYKAVTMLKRLGYSSTEANKMFDRVIDFEGKFAKTAYTSNDMMSPDYMQRANNVKTRSEVLKSMKNFPIKRFLKTNGVYSSKSFCVMNPKHLAKMDALYTKKNLSVIKEYLLVHYVLDMAPYLDQKAYNAHIKALQTINGSTGRISDEEYAYRKVTALLPTQLQKVYLQVYNADKKKEAITKLCEEAVAEYRQMLNETTWISEQTKTKAIEKLDALKINAVYPDRWPDTSGLNLKGKSYINCCRAIWKQALKQNIALTNGKVDHELWSVNTLDLNAYYEPTNNSIYILLGLLGEDLYRDDMTKEEIYGGIGATIGHEISHAFDTNGAQFDKEGNLSNWWTEADYEQFQKKANKLSSYLDTICAFDGQYVSGTNVQSEAIADITGLDCMLRLAKKDKNFDYDKFFRTYAKSWKAVSTKEYEYLLLTQDVHPLNYLRVNVPVQQFDEFYQTYNVKLGDRMYLAPQDRLTIW